MKSKRWIRGLIVMAVVGTAVMAALAQKPAPQKKRVVDGGYVRVVSVSDTPCSFNFELKFHHAPWGARQKIPKKGELPPGQASNWIHVPDLAKGGVVTVLVSSSIPVTNHAEVARVEFASEASTNAILRSLPVTDGPAIMECSKAMFQSVDDLKSDAEIGAALLADVKRMIFKGKAPRLFPTGYPGGHASMYEAGRLLGFNAIHRPAGQGRDMVERYGYKYIYTFSHLLGAFGQGYGYDRDKNAKQAELAGDLWKKAGLLENVYFISVRDEADLDVAKSVKTPLCAKASAVPNEWSQILKRAGVTPEALMRPDNKAPAGLDPMSSNYWTYVVGFTGDEKEVHRQGVYDTMKVAQAVWPTRFANASEAFHTTFGSNVLIVANNHINTYTKDNFSGLDPWMIYSRQRCLDVPQSCDYWIGIPQQEEFLIDLMRCAGRPHDKPVDAMMQAQSSYQVQTARSLKLRALSAVGAGARSLSFYEWGPRYMATENWYDGDRERLRVIGEINHAVGWVEDIVLKGRPAPARIAILYSRPSELWDRLAPSEGIADPRDYTCTRRILYHALRGLQQPVEMIQDEVLPAEQGINIDQYACIFMSQRCITAKGADLLLDWVRRGGTLIGIIACGQFDELEQPWDKMSSAFGLKSWKVSPIPKGEYGELEMAGIRFGHMKARIEVSDAKVLMKFADGSPAVTEKTLGKGRLIYSAWSPGAAYEAGRTMTNDVMVGLSEAVLPVVASWIRPAGIPVCEAVPSAVSARLIQSPVGAAVFLINTTGAGRVDKVRVTLHGIAVKSVESLECGKVPFTSEGDGVVVELPMGLTDILRISTL